MNHDAQKLRFELLGPVRAWRGNQELNLGGPRQRAMLAMLLLANGRLFTVDELVAGVWGDAAPARARHSLRTYASRLRAVIDEPGSGHESLLWAGGYLLRTPVDAGVDTREFDRLTRLAGAASNPCEAAGRFGEALRLINGLVLAGIPGPFAERQQRQWADRYVSTLEAKLDLDLACGRHAQAVADLSELAATHPWRESLHASLMRALYLCGRQADAFAVYEQIRSRLSDELGVDPGPGLRQMYVRILRGDLDLEIRTNPTVMNNSLEAVA